MAIDFGYSSDSSSDDYYLYDQKEYNLRCNLSYFLYTACELDRVNITLCSNPQDMANFLNDINAKHEFNIPVDLEDIKKKLAKSENRRKKFRKFSHKKKEMFKGVQEKSTKSCIIKKKRSLRKRKLLFSRRPNSPFLFSKTSITTENNLHLTNPNQETMFPFLSKISNPNQEIMPCFVNPEASTSSSISSPSTCNLTYQHSQPPVPLHDQVLMVNINDDHVPPRQVPEFPVPVIPEDGHHEPILVFRKSLSLTDTSKHHQRLLIPKLQVLHEFLTLEEERILRNQERDVIAAKLFDSNNVEYDINLKMHKVGKSSWCYVIGKPWNKIRENNGFGVGTNVQLLAFRRNMSELCFNLLRDDHYY